MFSLKEILHSYPILNRFPLALQCSGIYMQTIDYLKGNERARGRQTAESCLYQFVRAGFILKTRD